MMIVQKKFIDFFVKIYFPKKKCKNYIMWSMSSRKEKELCERRIKIMPILKWASKKKYVSEKKMRVAVLNYFYTV